MDKVRTSLLLILFFAFSLQTRGQDDGEISLPQFLLPEFSEGIIRLKNGQTRSMLLNYNVLTERVVYMQDGNPYDLIGVETIDSVFILDRSFTLFGKSFYEVAVKDRITLLIQHRGSLIPPGKPAPYGGVSHTSATTSYSSINVDGATYNLKMPSDYTVALNPVYWIRVDYEMHSFTKQAQFLKIFPGRENELKTFIKKNRIRFDRREHLVMLVEYCNSFY